MDELKIHIQYVMLWEFKNNKNTKETVKKMFSVHGHHWPLFWNWFFKFRYWEMNPDQKTHLTFKIL